MIEMLFVQEYELSIGYYWAPYLVDIDNVDGKRILKVEEIGKNGVAWKGADIISFNSGH